MKAARAASRPVTQREYEALASFRLAIVRFLAFSQEAARAAGLTPRQHQALLAVRGAPAAEPLTVGDLADRLGLRHHSAVGLVDRLVSLGLLARERATEDRRRVKLSLTASGRRRLERLSAAHRDELRRVGPRLRTLLAPLGTPRRARRRPRQ